MSRAKRAYDGQMMHFRKQLKRPFSIVADIMPDDFSDELFVSEFCACFSSLWRAIIEKHQMYSSKDKGRVKKGLKAIYHFPEAKRYVLWNARGVINRTRRNHAKGVIKPDEERASIRERYFKRSCIKEIARRKIEKKTQDAQQRVEPDFANYFIKIYFDVKHDTNDAINYWFDTMLNMADEQIFASSNRLDLVDEQRLKELCSEDDDETRGYKLAKMKIRSLNK